MRSRFLSSSRKVFQSMLSVAEASRRPLPSLRRTTDFSWRPSDIRGVQRFRLKILHGIPRDGHIERGRGIELDRIECHYKVLRVTQIPRKYPLNQVVSHAFEQHAALPTKSCVLGGQYSRKVRFSGPFSMR